MYSIGKHQVHNVLWGHAGLYTHTHKQKHKHTHLRHTHAPCEVTDNVQLSPPSLRSVRAHVSILIADRYPTNRPFPSYGGRERA